MKRLIAVLSLSCVMILSAGCGDGKTSGGGGGDPAGGGDLAKGETCVIASDRCAAGLLCHDQGTGPVCHDECAPAVWPSTVCNASDEACGVSGTSGACVPSLSIGASCDTVDDLCGAAAHCGDVTSGASPVCTTACTDNNGCLSSEACFVLGFLTGDSEAERVCATALAKDDGCDTAEAYCDALLDCRDLDASGPICWRFCDPGGDGGECGSDACVPDDYFAGTLDATTGVCTPYLVAADVCDPYWDICGDIGALTWVCADTAGGGAFECTRGCDLMATPAGCPAGSTTCAPLSRVNMGLDPTVGVCINELGIQEPCPPDADTCPENYGCAGDLTIGFLCRQHIADRVLAACIGGGLGPGDAQYGLPCIPDTGDPDPCNRGSGVGGASDCLADCPKYNRGSNDWVLQVRVAAEDDDWSFCVRKDDCILLFEVSADCPGADACVVFPSEATGSSLNLRTCIPAGTQDVGETCDELADRCLNGLACLAEFDGSGTCRLLCET
ncbi:MAG: hypothetical protein V3T05_11310, partial [Myxococcota bacterium]